MELVEHGEIDAVGVITEHTSWLGVPLKSDGKTLGVLVGAEPTPRASATRTRIWSSSTFVGQHVASALQRPGIGDETRGGARRAGAHQQRPGGACRRARAAGHLRPRRRQAPRHLRPQVVDIGVYDAEAGLVRFPYTIERGVRFPDEPIPLIGFRRHVMETREPLMINEDIEREGEKYGNPPVIGRGAVEVGDLDAARRRRRGHGRHLDPEPGPGACVHRVRLAATATLARSLSVALENARLVDETRQRAAELAIVNSVGQALSAHLDLPSLIDLVGERMRETFDADIVYVALHDPASGTIDSPTTASSGNGSRRHRSLSERD